MFVRETRGNRKKTHVMIQRSRHSVYAVHHHVSEFMTIITRTSRGAREYDRNTAEELDQKVIWLEDHPDGSRDTTTHITSEKKLSRRSSRTSALCMLYAVADVIAVCHVSSEVHAELHFAVARGDSIFTWSQIVPSSCSEKEMRACAKERDTT